MSIKLLRTVNLLISKGQHVRYGHVLRGKPPTVAHSLKQRLEIIKQMNEDPMLDFHVNIGYPVAKISRRTLTKIWANEIIMQRNNPELERASRTRKLLVNLKDAREYWLQTDGPFHIRKIAEHYNIYKDLYRDAYFIPTVPLNISYDLEDNKMVKVYTGNVIKPKETSKAPCVIYNTEDGSLWTLLMTTPDGNLTNSSYEYCHWFIGNIPGNHINKGEELIDYLKPIPSYGIGYCRYIFVLYKQECYINYSEYKKVKPCLNLEERNWQTRDFYAKYQDQLTPVGLAFFQSDWDDTIKEFYYSTLKMKMPIFRYNFPQPYIKKQTWFPLKEPFNLYMDKYRDPKQITKEFLLRKLKKVHPFKESEPKPQFPLAYHTHPDLPSWLKFEMIKKKLGYGRVNDLDEY
ncbi:39S ribosomal protein L38, mitochondrial [Harpegnathos saltator]|uniref:Large ribosomal subunit protein mL38 n=1 Tax=Harpegnathos saltator TaxID=610380 RepID=E2B354_HARSA|nr:39S ribosomal protein L38, mitochondrial [Harpegnathos saltator]XP_011135370.1 39S ribosomal protein L38, mitochondrial [Harpegnathos saltator]EFN89879.1 39S ribosomal protein L38, mitochondrial [Harpegnathos saltator]